MPDAPFPRAGETAALLSSLCWASSGILFARTGRMGGGVSGPALNLGKNLTGVGLFALTLTIVSGVPWPTGVAMPGAVLLMVSGLFGLTVCDTLLFRALLEIGPRRANLLMTVYVPATAIGALMPPWSEFPPPAAWLGMGVCLVGIALAILEKAPVDVDPDAWRRGVRDAVIAALAQATGLLLARLGMSEAWGGTEVTTMSAATLRMLSGSLGLVIVGLLLRRQGAWQRQLAQPGVLKRVIAAAVVGTYLGIWTNQAGLAWGEHTGVVTTLNSMAPVWLIPLSTVFLGESHDRRAWIATALAVGGVALLNIRP